MDESLLHRIWRDQLIRRSGLLTEDGRPVEVIFPGRWNGSAGPDFAGARVRIGGEERTGDVEVHWIREAWRAHGHDEDPAYDGVILHVVMYRGRDDETSLPARSGRDVPELVLEPLLAEGLRGLAAALGPGRGPAVAAAPAGAPEEGEARARALRESGWERVGERARRLRARTAAFGPDEALFRSHLEALGYRWNAGPCYEVARRIGWERLRDRVGPLPEHERAGAIRAILLRVAGLGDFGFRISPFASSGASGDKSDCGLEDDRRSESWLNLCAGIPPLDSSLWRRSGIRPANRPERRLSGAAVWLSDRMEQGLWEWLRCAWESEGGSVRGCESGSVTQSRAVDARTLARPHPPTDPAPGRTSARLVKLFVVPGLIGLERASVIWINAGAPLLRAWLEDRRDDDGLRRLREILDAADDGEDVLTRAWGDRWGIRPGSILARQGVYAQSRVSGF